MPYHRHEEVQSPERIPIKRSFSKKAVCLWFSGAFGVVLVVLSALVLTYGYDLIIQVAVPGRVAIVVDGPMFTSWLNPPVETFLQVYAFNVTNHEQVLNGSKPILEEVGPFVYRSTIVKDSVDILVDDDYNTMSYQPRKIYTFDRERSIDDPYQTFVNVPNLPLLTAMNTKGLTKLITAKFALNTGRRTPFVNVSVGGLLWGYDDDLPCVQMSVPKECLNVSQYIEDGTFSDEDNDDWELNDDFGDGSFFDNKRKKRSVYHNLSKPKAEFVDCQCQWGLFRDRNVTLREPVEFFTGSGPAALKKGQVKRFNGRTTFGWWKSTCDRVKGQDGSTFPSLIKPDMDFEILIPVLCRPLPLTFQKPVDHNGIATLRFALKQNALGSHNDTDPEIRNPENECYCLEDQGFDCFKSGVMDMGPCKLEHGLAPPLALSLPHFYGADSSFLNSVDGLNPQKSKHEFFVDLVPELGIPMAIRPRFQLNVVMKRDQLWEDMSNLGQARIVMPYLWVQDGFETPSEELKDRAIGAVKLPYMIVAIGGTMMLMIGITLMCSVYCCLLYCSKRKTPPTLPNTIPMNVRSNKHYLTSI